MKHWKTILLLLFFGMLLVFAFYKIDRPNLQGEWLADKIIIDGKTVYKIPEKVLGKISFTGFSPIHPEIKIDDRLDELTIYRIGSDENGNINAKFQLRQMPDGKWQMDLTSSEKALNGKFDLQLDTLNTAQYKFRIDATLSSGKTLIRFHKEVHTRPQKPKLPRRGAV